MFLLPFLRRVKAATIYGNKDDRENYKSSRVPSKPEGSFTVNLIDEISKY